MLCDKATLKIMLRFGLWERKRIFIFLNFIDSKCLGAGGTKLHEIKIKLNTQEIIYNEKMR